jgi:hypothetical protein
LREEAEQQTDQRTRRRQGTTFTQTGDGGFDQGIQHGSSFSISDCSWGDDPPHGAAVP